MRIATLAYVGTLLEGIGLPYAYMEWGDENLPDTYFIGSCLEHLSTTLTENGHQKTTFILRGWTKGSWLDLETYKEQVEKNISKTAILDDGTGVAIFYDSAMVVPTGVAGWKSIKINLNIQEWKVN